MNSEELTRLAISILENHKAVDIHNLDVRGLTSICDNMIICSATSRRHASAMADKLLRALREEGVKPFGLEGENIGEWVLVDLNDIVIHIMLPEIREFYNLEKLWSATQEIRGEQASNSNED